MTDHPADEVEEVREASDGGRHQQAYTALVGRLKHEAERVADALAALPPADELLPNDRPWLGLAPVEGELGKLRIKLDQLVDSLS